MANAQLIPPTRKPPSVRAVAIAVALGAGAGAAAAIVAWLITADVRWFYAVPVCALIGGWLRLQKPNVLWGTMASSLGLRSNPPVNADARDMPAPAKAVGARAGYRAR
jgi:hypothetical protein